MRFLPHIAAAAMVALGLVAAIRWSRPDPPRLRRFVGIGLLLHGLVLAVTLVQVPSCRHETPLGIVGGRGQTMAKGSIASNIRQVLRTEQKRKIEQQQRLRPTRESLLQILRRHRDASAANPAELAAMADTVGLPAGVGTGATAAGSPHGTRIGGKLYLYRVRHGGEGWNANARALPTLLRTVHAAIGVEVAGRQETISLTDLAEHRGKYLPRMLFITGTGPVLAGEEERKNLRDYLLGGGMLVADSSGGSFESHFVSFIQSVLPGHRLRPIEFDNDVYRGGQMPYQLPRGCPTYRDHGSPVARGVFDKDDRLMVFLSPGDLGSAWAAVDLGRSRSSVELAFQMGTNLVAYAMITVYDRREKGGGQ